MVHEAGNGEATKARHLREPALDHPAMRQQHEPAYGLGKCNHHHLDSMSSRRRGELYSTDRHRSLPPVPSSPPRRPLSTRLAVRGPGLQQE